MMDGLSEFTVGENWADAYMEGGELIYLFLKVKMEDL